MNKFLTLLFLIGLSAINSQAQNWAWERSHQGTNHTYGNATTVDMDGNIYVTGSFFGPHISFGNIVLTNFDTVNNFSDFFIVKYDPMGNVLWARSAGGSNSDAGNALTTDNAGNVYVTGKFRSPSIAFDNTVLTNNTAYFFDVFLVKYSPNGSVIWAQEAGGDNDDIGMSLATNSNGNLFLTGTFKSSTITFGSHTLANMGVGYEDIFLVKYDTSGNVIWLNTYGGAGVDGANKLVLDGSGNIYLAGSFASPNLHFGNITLIRSSTYDMFVVKFDSTGMAIWANSAGTTSYNPAQNLCLDNSGNVFVTGYFEGATITFGLTTLTNSGTGTAEMFLVKYAHTGSVVWAKSAGGSSDEFGYGCIANGNNVVVTGSFKSPSVTFGNITLMNRGSQDMYIAEYDGAGNVVFAKTAGGSGWDVGMSVALDALQNLYVAGSYSSDTMAFDTDTLFGIGYYKMFLAKISLLTTETPTIPSASSGMEIYPNPSNGNFSIRLEKNNCELRITDVMGRLVYSQVISTMNSQLSLPLQDGIYFLTVSNEEGMMKTDKIVIMK